MSKDNLLSAIIDYCQLNKMAESTFGRKSVNDGKFVSRLRTGARVTPDTWSKVRKFIIKNAIYLKHLIFRLMVRVLEIYKNQLLNSIEKS